MAEKTADQSSKAPDNSGVALVIIDMINDLEFPGGDTLFAPALSAAKHIAALKQRAKAAGVPVIYANDNFGRWRSDFRDAVERCLQGNVRGTPLAELLAPEEDDYFVLKPKHSAFFATAFEALLDYLGCRCLILTGISGNMCVQLTAGDAKMRDFIVQAPEDCMASNTPEQHQQSVSYIRDVLGLSTEPSKNLDLSELRNRRDDIRR